MFWRFNLCFLFLTKIGFVPWPDVMLSQTLIYIIDKKSSFWLWCRQWSHPLMIQLPCLLAKSNNRTRGQFECDVTWFRFCFNFVCSHARCGCFSVVCLRFQVVQIKQVDYKMSTKNVSNYKQKIHFVILLENCTCKSIKPRKSREWGFHFEIGEGDSFEIEPPRSRGLAEFWT